jgi:integrase
MPDSVLVDKLGATGLRASNVQYLQWADVGTERRPQWIHAAAFMAGKTHVIPLSGHAMAIRRRQLGMHHTWVLPQEDHAAKGVSTTTWHLALTRAGIENFR